MLLMGSGEADKALLGELTVHGTGEEKSLELVAAERAEDGVLPFGFNAFRDYFHVEGVGHGNDVLDDGSIRL